MVIHDKSQGSVATHLRRGGYVIKDFFVMFAGERIFKIGKYLAKLQAIGMIASHAIFSVFHALSCLKVQISPDNLRMMDISCY